MPVTILMLNDRELKLRSIVPSAVKRLTDQYCAGSVPSTLKDSQRTTASSLIRSEQSLPNGWVRIKHPDAGVYYFHKEKVLCTWSDVRIQRVHDLVMEAADALRGNSVLQNVLELHGCGLVLDTYSGREDGRSCSYYGFSHDDRRIFWLEEVDVPCMEAQYWKHCELFPTAFSVTREVTDDLKDILLQASADRLLVKFSTSPYDKDDLAYMMNVVKEIEGGVSGGKGSSSWVIAKFMSLHNDGVLRSSYGQSDDDFFDIDRSEPSSGPYRRPYLLALLAPLLLKSPDVYAEELYSFHENFTPERWSKFVRKVDISIRDSNLLATVLLSTNIVTYVSIICSVGSIIIGLAIFKQYRAKGADTPLRAVTVLKRILQGEIWLGEARDYMQSSIHLAYVGLV
ncbi:hypothetical protein BU15DRAFT_74189 [Melanogaster broomeanus]|nr:hypothetical protein BU15DRAFT_74189 [Melanogaster broomeanus]